MKKLTDILIFASIISSIGIFSSASILASSKSDPHGCHLSPNNYQCELNRPTEQARTESNNSFQLKYNESNGSIQLVQIDS